MPNINDSLITYPFFFIVEVEEARKALLQYLVFGNCGNRFVYQLGSKLNKSIKIDELIPLLFQQHEEVVCRVENVK